MAACLVSETCPARANQSNSAQLRPNHPCPRLPQREDDRHPLVDFRLLGAQIFLAVGCRSRAEGMHAEAYSIIAVDHGNIGSLSSMRRADGHQIG
jgi:hypothetical protein